MKRFLASIVSGVFVLGFVCQSVGADWPPECHKSCNNPACVKALKKKGQTCSQCCGYYSDPKAQNSCKAKCSKNPAAQKADKKVAKKEKKAAKKAGKP